jgi:hypothetical protein
LSLVGRPTDVDEAHHGDHSSRDTTESVRQGL